MLAWIVVLIVAVGELGAPETRAVTEVLHRAAPEAQVRVIEEAPGSPIAPNEIRVVMRWESSRQKVDLEWAAVDRSVHSSLVFSPIDEASERGRAVGLVLASLMPEPIARSGGPVVQAPSTLPRRGLAARAPEDPSKFALDMLGVAGSGLLDEGVAVEFGGAFGVRYFALPRLSLRADFRIAGETLPSSSATGFVLGGTAGVAYSLLSHPAGLPLDLELELDLGVQDLRVTHFSDDDAYPVTRDSAMFVGMLGLDLVWEITRHFGLMAHFHTELVSTSVEVRVSGEPTATRGLLRLNGGIGVRVTM